MSISISRSGNALVDRNYHYIKIDENTPRGVALQLIVKADGTACRGIYDGTGPWTHYAPFPTFDPQESADTVS